MSCAWVLLRSNDHYQSYFVSKQKVVSEAKRCQLNDCAPFESEEDIASNSIQIIGRKDKDTIFFTGSSKMLIYDFKRKLMKDSFEGSDFSYPSATLIWSYENIEYVLFYTSDGFLVYSSITSKQVLGKLRCRSFLATHPYSNTTWSNIGVNFYEHLNYLYGISSTRKLIQLHLPELLQKQEEVQISELYSEVESIFVESGVLALTTQTGVVALLNLKSKRERKLQLQPHFDDKTEILSSVCVSEGSVIVAHHRSHERTVTFYLLSDQLKRKDTLVVTGQTTSSSGSDPVFIRAMKALKPKGSKVGYLATISVAVRLNLMVFSKNHIVLAAHTTLDGTFIFGLLFIDHRRLIGCSRNKVAIYKFR